MQKLNKKPFDINIGF